MQFQLPHLNYLDFDTIFPLILLVVRLEPELQNVNTLRLRLSETKDLAKVKQTPICLKPGILTLGI